MILYKLIGILLFLGITSLPVIAGGWPQPKGGYYLKLSEWWIVSDQHFDRNGMVEPNFVEYGYYATSLYAEYGFSKRVTGYLNFPFINYTYTVLPGSMIKQSIWKPGDVDIGMKYAVTLEKPVAVSVSLILGVPLGYTDDNSLQTGDGEFNQILRADASSSFRLFNSNAWINLYSGYNHRSNNYADEFQYGLETGMDISKDKLSVTLRFAGIEALGDDEGAPHVNAQSLFSNYRKYLSFSPEVAYHISKSWGITIGAGTAFYGQNIFANTSFTVGVFHKTVPDKMEQQTSFLIQK